MNHLKLIVLGHIESGKTQICNYLSEAVEQVSGEYHPTVGVRIIEFEVNLPTKSKQSKVELELWDVSGNKKYESCWPAIFKGTNGVLFVYNANKPDHIKAIEKWQALVKQFVQIKDSECCVICHQKQVKLEKEPIESAPTFNGMVQFSSNILQEGDKLRDNFGKFVGNLLSGSFEANEQEELSIMNF